MYSDNITCSVNPSNLILPVRVNPKFYKKNIERKNKFFVRQSETEFDTYTFYKEINFPRVNNMYIKPMISPLRFTNSFH